MEPSSAIDSQPISGYELQKPLGKGAFGTVYKALQISLSRPVAIKVLSPKLARDRRYVKRFVREARTAGRLLHPNVVQVLDVGRSGKYYYYVMEFVPGRSLQQVLDEDGQLPESRLLHVGLSVAQALKAGEKVGLIHGDIKPANLMATPEGVIKLTDYGIARQRVGGPADEPGEAAGLGYLAPECRDGDPEPDLRSDVYSLGATLCTLATGRQPQEPDPGGSGAEDSSLALADPKLKLSGELCAAILKMLEEDPDRRYQQPGEVLEVLERIGGATWLDEEPFEEPEKVTVEKRRERKTKPAEKRPAAASEDTTPAKAQEPRKLAPAKARSTSIAREFLHIAASALFGALVVYLLYQHLIPLGLERFGFGRVPRTGAFGPAGMDDPGFPPTESEAIDRMAPARPEPSPAETKPDLDPDWAQLAQQVKDHPTDYRANLRSLRAFLARAQGTDLEDEVQRVIAEQEKQLRAGALAFDAAQAKAAEFVKKGQYGQAIAAYRSIPASVVTPKLRTQIDAQLSHVTSLARSYWNERKRLARSLVAAGSLDDACALLSTAQDLGLPAIEEEVKEEVRRLESRSREAREQRTLTARGKFEEVRSAVRKRYQALDLDGAESTLAEAMKSEDLSAAAAEARAELTDLRIGKSVLAAALQATERSVGAKLTFQNLEGTIRGVRDSRILLEVGEAETAVRVDQLGTSEIVRLAIRILSPTRPDHQLALGVFLLRVGELDKARTYLGEAGARGEDVERYLRELDEAATQAALAEGVPDEEPEAQPRERREIPLEKIFKGRVAWTEDGLLHFVYDFKTEEQLRDFSNPFTYARGRLVARRNEYANMTHIAPFTDKLAVELQVANCRRLGVYLGAENTTSSRGAQTLYGYYNETTHGYYATLSALGGGGLLFRDTIPNWPLNKQVTIKVQRVGAQVSLSVNGKKLYDREDNIGFGGLQGYLAISNNRYELELSRLEIIGEVSQDWLEKMAGPEGE